MRSRHLIRSSSRKIKVEDGFISLSCKMMFFLSGSSCVIREGVIKAEFAVNSHNLILTFYASDIRVNEDKQQNVSARFKIFDLEHNKENLGLSALAFSIKKALVKVTLDCCLSFLY